MAPRAKARPKNMSSIDIAKTVGSLGKGALISIDVLPNPGGDDDANVDAAWHKPFTISGILEKDDCYAYVGMFNLMTEDYYGTSETFSNKVKSITVLKAVELPDNTVIKDKFGVIWTKHNGSFVSPGGGSTRYEDLIEPSVIYMPEDEDEDDDE